MGYFSALHFEAFTLGIQPHLADVDPEDADRFGRFKSALLETKTDTEFRRLTTGGGKNYAAALKQRIEFVEKKVEECLQ